MPEGDTIHKIAAFLRERLEGRDLTGGAVRDQPTWTLAGRRVTEVSAHGKHLFIRFRDGTALRSHLGMWGGWHVYAPGERWKKPRRQASVELRTEDDVFVCFLAEEVEALRSGGIPDRERRARLGPDLISEEDAPARAVPRARRLLAPDTPLADVLLDQRVAAGIGNVYKSEVLFLHSRAPRTALGEVPDAELRAMLATAARLLRANLGPGERVTHPGGGEALWVYGRARQPCLRCGSRIRHARLGRHHRDTYWCPACQR